MAAYVFLTKWTQPGIADVKGAPERITAAKAGIEAAGGHWIGYWITMGQYDGVGLVDLDGDETAAKIVIGLAMQGNVTTQTMRAFSEDEFADIVAGLP